MTCIFDWLPAVSFLCLLNFLDRHVFFFSSLKLLLDTTDFSAARLNTFQQFWWGFFSVDCIKTKKHLSIGLQCQCVDAVTSWTCLTPDQLNQVDFWLGTWSCFIHYSYSASLHKQGNQRICMLGVTLQETSFPVGRRNTPSHFMQRGYSQPDGPIGLNADFTNLWHYQYFSGFF